VKSRQRMDVVLVMKPNTIVLCQVMLGQQKMDANSGDYYGIQNVILLTIISHVVYVHRIVLAVIAILVLAVRNQHIVEESAQSPLYFQQPLLRLLLLLWLLL